MIEINKFKKMINKASVAASETTNQLVGSLLAGDKKKRPPVLWLGTNTCAGDSISFLNSLDPGYRAIITDLIDFRYNHFVMSAEGDMSTGVLEDTLSKCAGEYILIVEGTANNYFTKNAIALGRIHINCGRYRAYSFQWAVLCSRPT